MIHKFVSAIRADIEVSIHVRDDQLIVSRDIRENPCVDWFGDPSILALGSALASALDSPSFSPAPDLAFLGLFTPLKPQFLPSLRRREAGSRRSSAT